MFGWQRRGQRHVWWCCGGDDTGVEDGVEGYDIEMDGGRFVRLGAVDHTLVDLEG